MSKSTTEPNNSEDNEKEFREIEEELVSVNPEMVKVLKSLNKNKIKEKLF